MTAPRAHIIDDDDAVRDAMSMLLSSADIDHASYSSAELFLKALDKSVRGCLVLDIRMPTMSGLELQAELTRRDANLPIIFMTGHGDVPMAVEAMRRGALNFLRKPVDEDELLDSISQAMTRESEQHERHEDQRLAELKLAALTDREREVFDCVCEGSTNKSIAERLGISERTVEVHRGQVMKKLEARSVADLVRLQISVEATPPVRS